MDQPESSNDKQLETLSEVSEELSFEWRDEQESRASASRKSTNSRDSNEELVESPLKFQSAVNLVSDLSSVSDGDGSIRLDSNQIGHQVDAALSSPQTNPTGREFQDDNIERKEPSEMSKSSENASNKPSEAKAWLKRETDMKDEVISRHLIGSEQVLTRISDRFDSFGENLIEKVNQRLSELLETVTTQLKRSEASQVKLDPNRSENQPLKSRCPTCNRPKVRFEDEDEDHRREKRFERKSKRSKICRQDQTSETSEESEADLEQSKVSQRILKLLSRVAKWETVAGQDHGCEEQQVADQGVEEDEFYKLEKFYDNRLRQINVDIEIIAAEAQEDHLLQFQVEGDPKCCQKLDRAIRLCSQCSNIDQVDETRCRGLFLQGKSNSLMRDIQFASDRVNRRLAEFKLERVGREQKSDRLFSQQVAD